MSLPLQLKSCSAPCTDLQTFLQEMPPECLLCWNSFFNDPSSDLEILKILLECSPTTNQTLLLTLQKKEQNNFENTLNETLQLLNSFIPEKMEKKSNLSLDLLNLKMDFEHEIILEETLLEQNQKDHDLNLETLEREREEFQMKQNQLNKEEYALDIEKTALENEKETLYIEK